jgi:hypothetical protein
VRSRSRRQTVKRSPHSLQRTRRSFTTIALQDAGPTGPGRDAFVGPQRRHHGYRIASRKNVTAAGVKPLGVAAPQQGPDACGGGRRAAPQGGWRGPVGEDGPVSDHQHGRPRPLDTGPPQPKRGSRGGPLGPAQPDSGRSPACLELPCSRPRPHHRPHGCGGRGPGERWVAAQQRAAADTAGARPYVPVALLSLWASLAR